ncbi:TetR/AcrR family transcriptional regulator [Niabella beijingensis]|uniref:TetR/AcrR family transcriptional regulator n=1 Tax=Niabella beijingensis TaxID=2872700 RepID=UPI001CBD58D9|nr:TetR/AcrR family transcriptional regulator [Niabella beijingensis]MBZ4189914.1 TetR/AcrR family transcriptional regulator [Niabella beijingensis]
MARKTGPRGIYNKERTKEKLIAAVGRILVKDGFQSIKVNRIEAESGVSKKLIYLYFDGLDGLINAYLMQTDFWNQEREKAAQSPPAEIKPLEKDMMSQLFRDDFEYFATSAEMQKIILWGISEKNKAIKKIADVREDFGVPVFEASDLVFKDTDIDFRAVAGLFVGAIYYIVLHGKMIDSTICGIDPNTKEGRERFIRMIDKLLELCYGHKKER